MELEHTQCCAVEEIADLSYHSTPEEAMTEFIEAIKEASDDRCDSNDPLLSMEVPGLITFTGVVRCRHKDRDCKTGYGEAFAAFIRKNRLGTVTASAMRPNRINHPEHTVRLWVWAPSPRNLVRWDARSRQPVTPPLEKE